MTRISSYVLSNGKREIVFEAMIHVGKRSYYQQVKESIRRSKEKGHRYFYEYIKKSTEQDEVELGKFMGLDSVKTLKELYKFLGMLTGLEQQPQEEFIGLVNDNDVNVDLTVGDLVREMKGVEIPETKLTLDKVLSFQEGYQKLNPVLKFVVKHGVRFAIRRVLKSDVKNKKPASEIIRAVRDDHLVSEVLKTDDNLVITYGAAHFKGFYEKLTKADPSWKIISSLDRSAI